MDKTKLAVDLFNHYANDYQNKYMDVSGYHETLDLFCKSIENKNAKILELACGPGNITKYILDKQPNFNILATDLAPEMLKLAKENNPKADVRIMDCKGISQLKAQYDGIICGFGLPYLTKEETIKFINDSSRALVKGGVIYLSTMEDDYEKSSLKSSSDGKHQLFMHYHEANYLLDSLTSSGFKILHEIRQDFPEKDQSITTDLIIIAEKL